MSEIAKRGWEDYILQLQCHPLSTKAITVGVLAGVNDTTVQKLSGIQKLQYKCLLLKILFGFFGHYLQKVLDRIYKGKKDKKTIAKKEQQNGKNFMERHVFVDYLGPGPTILEKSLGMHIK